LCDGYGLSERERIGLPELLVLRMEASASGIEALAAEGVPAHRRWAAEGVPALIRTDGDWVERHREVLRDVGVRCDDPPHDEAARPSLRAFHTASPSTPVNKATELSRNV
jgi:hypothetical protein